MKCARRYSAVAGQRLVVDLLAVGEGDGVEKSGKSRKIPGERFCLDFLA